MLDKFWARIWDFCELHGISLGRSAPFVFGKMMNRMRVGSAKWLIRRMYDFISNFKEGEDDFHLSQEEVDELLTAAEEYLGIES
jgi:hypothetical protein